MQDGRFGPKEIDVRAIFVLASRSAFCSSRLIDIPDNTPPAYFVARRPSASMACSSPAFASA
jgi:hypothetical protein